jgi:pimeloyl-ACP methyl ester carboxylesterase
VNRLSREIDQGVEQDAINGVALTHAFTRESPRLHYVAAGSGSPVILLHGFPAFWYGWRHQIAPLVKAGYRVVVPDQRGYNRSEKPPRLWDYRLDALAADVLRLADAAGGARFTLVGHDWGAAVAWWVGLHYPERLDRLVILNVPHPAVFRRALRSNPHQMLRSWYVLFFQLPWLPEYLLGRGRGRGLADLLRRSSHPGAFSDADLKRYRAAWRQPGALTGMLAWYRALLRYPATPRYGPRVRVPALILWGVHDVALGRELAPPSRALCDDGALVFFERASHWVHDEEPARVNDLLLRFLAGGTAAVPSRYA